MPLVRLLVRDEKRDETFAVLEDIGVDFVILSVEERDVSLVSFPVPTGAVQGIFDLLRDEDLELDQYTITSELNSAQTPNFEELEKQYTEGPEAESRIPREKLRTTARDIEPDRTTFVAQTILSATVAAAGLLLKSAIVIVGSMVISPFTSSLLSAALGVIIGDHDLLTDSLRSQWIGLLIAVGTGVSVGLFAQWIALVPPSQSLSHIKQINDFSSPNLLVVLIAIAAGSASAFALAADEGITLAGVAIAVALVPSAATAGLGIAWQQFSVGLGALELLVTNVIAINISSLLTFLLLGYQPRRFKDQSHR